jgi:hypothetical protein
VEVPDAGTPTPAPEKPAAPQHPSVLDQTSFKQANFRQVTVNAVVAPTPPIIKRGSLILNVPMTAKVWINGMLTKTTGQRREYGADLAEGRQYKFHVVVRDGDRQAVRDVFLTAGQTKVVK